MERAKLIIRDLLAAIFMASVQVAFITELPWYLKGVNLPLLVLVFFLSGASESALWRWVAGLGIVLDLYSFLPMGFYTGTLLAVALAVSWVFRKFFTNKSIYSSLVLTAIAYLIFHAFLLAGRYVFSGIDLGRIGWAWWRSFGAGLSVNLIAAFIFFYAANILSPRSLPFFISRRD